MYIDPKEESFSIYEIIEQKCQKNAKLDYKLNQKFTVQAANK